MRESLESYCRRMALGKLLEQWDAGGNRPLTPDQVSYGSHQKVWWQCEKGHRWQAQVKSRVAGCACPVCAGREILASYNDLASRYPQLAAQWHLVKNGALKPEEVAAGSKCKVWWLCPKGHEWQATVVSRASGGSGCPVCAGKRVIAGENDLASQFPAIAAQWHPTRNGSLKASQVTPYANRKVWWQCGKGHDYQATVGSRTMSGSGCPYCAGRKVLAGFNDLATLEPEVAAQWHPTLNGTLTPEMVTPGAHRKVWWICEQGHVWKAAVFSRTSLKRTGCPVCAGHVSGRRLERYQALEAAAGEAMRI